MRKIRKMSFDDLVKENKEELLNDQKELEGLEERWELRMISQNEM